jgi:hypothetical protein
LSDILKVAEVQGVSGTFVAPTQSPYDRQVLREHIERLANRVATLTLSLDGECWTVARCTHTDVRCATCAQFVGGLSCSRAADPTVACIDCVLRSGNDQQTEGDNS